MEIAQDLIERWNTLAPNKRLEIASKLLKSQGEKLPHNISKRALDDEAHKRLMKLVNDART